MAQHKNQNQKPTQSSAPRNSVWLSAGGLSPPPPTKEEIDQLRKEAKKAQEGSKSATAELEKQIAELRQQLTQVKQEKEKIEGEKVQLLTAVTEAQKISGESQKTSAQLQKDLEDLREKNRALADKVAKLEKENPKPKQSKPEHKVLLDEDRIANTVVERLRGISRAEGISFFDSLSRAGGVGASRAEQTRAKPTDAKKEKTRTPGGDLTEMAGNWSEARLLLIIAISRAAQLKTGNAVEQVLEEARTNTHLAPFTKCLEDFKTMPLTTKGSGARKRLVKMLEQLILEQVTPQEVYEKLVELASSSVTDSPTNTANRVFYGGFIAVLNKNTISWSKKDPNPALTEENFKKLPSKEERTAHLERIRNIYNIFKEGQPSFLPRKIDGLDCDFEAHFKQQWALLKAIDKEMDKHVAPAAKK